MRTAASIIVALGALVACSSDDAAPGPAPPSASASGETDGGGTQQAETDIDEAAGSTVVDGVEVLTVERTPASTGGPTVLFLHGAAFTSADWVELGILDDTASAGFRAVAIDLPGFGATASIAGDRGAFLRALIEQIDDGTGVVVVSPSMSGSFSLDLLASGAPATMVGFVPVAPVGISGFVDGLDTPNDELPTLIVWGANDGVDLGQAERLASALPDSSIEIIADAGHAAYRDQPAAFVRLLTEFLEQLSESV